MGITGKEEREKGRKEGKLRENRRDKQATGNGESRRTYLQRPHRFFAFYRINWLQTGGPQKHCEDLEP